MKSAGEAVEILVAFDLTGSLRDAARLAGCSPLTVARCVRLRETGRLRAGRDARRDQLVDPHLAKVEEWVERSHGRVRADVVHDKLRARLRRLRADDTARRRSGEEGVRSRPPAGLPTVGPRARDVASV